MGHSDSPGRKTPEGGGPSATIGLLLVALGLAVSVPGRACAAIPPPLPYDVEGTYWVDRWGQHRFASHFVFPDLAPRLNPLAHSRIRLTVTKRLLDHDRQPWIILDFKDPVKLDPPYEVILSFLEPLRPATSAEKKQLMSWIDQLDSPKYVTRQKAEHGLIKAGVAALPWLRPALKHPSLEASRRAQRCIDAICHTPDTAGPAHKPHATRPNDPVHLKVTVTNRSGEDQPAVPVGLALRHTSRYPFRPTGQHAYVPKKAPPERELSPLAERKIKRTFLFYHDDHAALLPASQTAYWNGGGPTLWSKSGLLPALKKGESVVWVVTVHKAWDAEAELMGKFFFEAKNKTNWLQTNSLRLDVLGDQRPHKQPLRIEIRQAKKAAVKPGQPIPVEIVFSNTSPKPIAFELPCMPDKAGHRFVTFDLLFAYDDAGTLLRGDNPGETCCYHVVRLKPGESKAISAEVPHGATWARVAFPGGCRAGVLEDNNGGPQIPLDDPHGSLSLLTRLHTQNK
jgi:hypothetical protein